MQKIFIAAILLGAANASATSFDCTKRVTTVEKAICDDAALTQLDEQLAKAYEDARDRVRDQSMLVASQRAWLQQRDRCIDKRCLLRTYQERLNEVKALSVARTDERLTAATTSLPIDPKRADPASAAGQTTASPLPRPLEPIAADRGQMQTPSLQADANELKPFRPAVPIVQAPPRTCAFSNLQLPDDFRVLATGAYTGRKLSFQIDQSGHNATQFDVAVNSPDKPVVLILGAYEPTIWNIGWSQKTRIAAVFVSGHHRQAIAGLDPKVPTLNSSYEDKGPCDYFYPSANGGLEKLNPLARKLFGKPVDLVYPAAQGVAVVGERIADLNDMVTHPAKTPESFHNPSAPVAGPAGLEEAARAGSLRRATRSDAEAWVDAVAASTPNRDVPPVAGIGVPRPRLPSLFNGFVVLKPFSYPEGLYGANGATFFVAKGVPRPTGNPGHSAVYDFNTLTCYGVLCNAGR